MIGESGMIPNHVKTVQWTGLCAHTSPQFVQQLNTGECAGKLEPRTSPLCLRKKSLHLHTDQKSFFLPLAEDQQSLLERMADVIQAHTSTSNGLVPIGFHRDSSESHLTTFNMEQNLCDFCQTIPFRVQENPTPRGLRRAQEQSGKIQLFSRKSLSDEWVSDTVQDTTFGLGHKRTDTIPGFPSITASAAAGCDFCRFLLAGDLKEKCNTVCADTPDVSAVCISFVWRCTMRDGHFSLRDLILRAEFSTSEGNTVGDYHNFISYSVVAEEHSSCANMLRITDRPPTATSWDRRLSLMKLWITNCERHPHTRTLTGDVPTRLLHVGSQDNIHLIDCKGKTNLSQWRYIALSHCWGLPHRPPLRTTKNSLDERFRHIPFTALPKNYQDAVTVTQALGVKYLWVDSLCIIQDSITDWENESTRMHEVYQNAYLTIIAANGSSCHDGFLDFKPEPQVGLHFKSSTDPSSNGTYLIWNSHNAETEIEKSQWKKRGWTFQEEIFSERRFYFTAHDIAYYCPRGLKYMLDLHRLGPWNMRAVDTCEVSRLMEEISPTEPRFLYALFDLWRIEVELYSGRIFTNSEDRLPALSARVKSLVGFSGGRYKYCAGLWTENLHLWLLWRCEFACPSHDVADRLRHATGSEFIAPSWSWASQSQAVSYDFTYGFEFDSCAVQAMEPLIEVYGLDPYGRIRNGSLRVTGKARAISGLAVRKTPRGKWKRDDLYDVNEHIISMHFDWMGPFVEETEKGQEPHCKTITKLSMLLLASQGRRKAGLLLYPSGEDGVYFRVGAFTASEYILESDIFDDCEICTIQIV